MPARHVVEQRPQAADVGMQHEARARHAVGPGVHGRHVERVDGERPRLDGDVELAPFLQVAHERRNLPDHVTITSSDRGWTLSATRARPSLIARARASPTPSTPTRSQMLARMILGSRPKRSITWSAIASGRRGMLVEQPVAARLHRRVEIHLGRQAEQRADDTEVEELLVGELRELGDDELERAVRRFDEVVAAHEPAVVLDAAGQLLELELRPAGRRRRARRRSPRSRRRCAAPSRRVGAP